MFEHDAEAVCDMLVQGGGFAIQSLGSGVGPVSVLVLFGLSNIPLLVAKFGCESDHAVGQLVANRV